MELANKYLAAFGARAGLPRVVAIVFVHRVDAVREQEQADKHLAMCAVGDEEHVAKHIAVSGTRT